MKKFAILLLIGLAFVILPGCRKRHTESYTYTLYTPVFKPRAEVLNNIANAAPKELTSPGKIFIKGHYLLINEVDKGIHIYDNADPAHPKNVAFVNIPGNVDVAMRGDHIYADMFGELVTVDVSNPEHIKLENVTPNAFPERAYPSPDPSLMLVGFIKKDTTVESVWYSDWQLFGGQKSETAPLASASDGSKGLSGAPGMGGSSARFALVDNYLYTAGLNNLGTYSLADPAKPDSISQTVIGWGIETIYPFQNNLFLGSATGMFIFDITEADAPVNKGAFGHVMSCDPVIADEQYAYVTLRDGTTCNGDDINQLEVLDITDVSRPQLLASYPMHNPHGLAKDGNHLFICDGTEGLKVFDASNPMQIRLMTNVKGFEAADVIAWDHQLIITGDDGIYQYDYSNINKLKLLSKLSTPKKSRKG